MSFMPLFGQFTILSLNLVNFQVSRFHVSHLTHETFKLRLQNTLNTSKTARVYFGVLQYIWEIVWLHRVQVSIVSDRDPRFTAHFWKSF